MPIHAQETDPLAVAAIMAQTSELGDELDRTASAQAATTATNLTITMMVDSIRKYDKIMLDYMQKANSVFNNIYYAADALEIASGVVKKLGKIMTAVKNHPRGALVSAVAKNSYSDIIAETGALTGQITSFVKGSGKGNLLTSAERMNILYNVHSKLRKIDRKLNSLYYNITTLEWGDLGRILNPELYWQLQTSEKMLEKSKKRINRMMSSF